MTINTNPIVQFSYWIIILFALLCSSNYSHAQTVLPEKMIFDLYVAGDFSGGLLVDFTDEWAEINDPEAVAERLQYLKNHKEVAKLLSQRLISEEPRVLKNIGTATASPNFFRIDLNIDSSQFTPQKLALDHYIPEPENNLALQISLRGTASSNLTLEENNGSSIFHKNTISRGRWKLEWDGDIAQTEGYNLNTLATSYEDGYHTYSMGLISTSGLTFANQQPIFGVEMTTNFKSQGDLEYLTSTPVQVFVPSRAEVQVYQYGTKIIYTRILDFGLQEIDTSYFPDGSYEVLIKIIEDTGTITEERQRYVKSDKIAPRNRPNITLQAGILRSDFELQDSLLYLVSYGWRVWDDTELKFALYGGESSFVFEPKVTVNLEDADIETALSLSSHGDTALYLDGRYRMSPSLFGQVTVFKTLTGHHQLDDIMRDLAPKPTEFDFKSEIIARETFSANGSINFTLDDWSLRYNGNYTESALTKKFAYGPVINWNAYSTKEHIISTEFRHSRTSNTNEASVLAKYRWRPDNQWSVDNTLARKRAANEDSNELRQTINYTTNDRLVSGQGTSLQAMHYMKYGNSKTTSSEAQINHIGEKVSVLGNGRYINNENSDDSESLNIEVGTNIYISQKTLFSKDRDIQVTSKSGSDATALIEITGNAIGEEVRIIVNSQPRSYGKVGETVAVNLPLYKKLEITIEPNDQGKNLLSYDQTPRIITMYPGNIVKKSWRVDKSYLVLGRLINSVGKPIEWQTVKGLGIFSSTDGIGQFQIEMTGYEAPYIQNDNFQCTLALPPISTSEYLINVGDVVCG